MNSEEDFIYVRSTQLLHLEISSFCNASCPGCSSTIEFGVKKDHLEERSFLPLELFKEKVSPETIRGLKEVLFCGNSGDPLTHPHLFEFCEYLKNENQNINLHINTNGGLGSLGFWKSIAPFFSNEGSSIDFALDGLEDTHSIYRKKVSFLKVLENARTFIDQGGRAVWKFISFPHNEHQLEEAQRLSKEMGFYKFIHRKNHLSAEEIRGVSMGEEIFFKNRARLQEKSDEEIKTMTLDKLSQKFRPDSEIDCESRKLKSFYIDSRGLVWPCCFIGSEAIPMRDKLEREWFHRNIMQKYAYGFNSLKLHSFEEIVQHDWFHQELVQSWRGTRRVDSQCSPACVKSCAVKEG